MAELISRAEDLPTIPDDLSLPQFMLDYQHPLKPVRANIPCLIEDHSGRKIDLNELRINTHALAEYITAMWAVHLLGGVVSCSNPQFNPGELLRQLKIAKISFIIAHSSNISAVLTAARPDLPCERIILIDQVPLRFSMPRIENVPNLIQEGIKKNLKVQERVFAPGEGRTKVALLSWSSGTTGKQKAVALSHYGLIANILQMAAHNQSETTSCFRNSRGFRAGDVAIGVLPFYRAAPVPKEIQARLCVLFPDAQIGQAYGLTEMTATLAMLRGTQRRGPLGSGGKLLPGVQVRVIKPDGSLAGYGEPGELVVKGPAVALGYLNDEQA
ncbi:hypothetical protein H0H93_008782 [Arthromyces matolae]|nr:hypothetical protein H0H93_008782 [Arthromyces matolae]